MGEDSAGTGTGSEPSADRSAHSGDPHRRWLARAVRLALILLLIIGLALLLVPLADVFMLIFSAVLIAVLFRAAAMPFQRIGLGETPSVFCGVILIIAILALSGYMFGNALAAQLDTLLARLPAAVESLRGWVATLPFGEGVARTTPDLQGAAMQAVNFAFGAFGVLTNLIVVLIAAIYLALQPRLYARGMVLMFPQSQAARVEQALFASGTALHKYLLGQFFTMALVGTLVGTGLAIVGVPSAAALGLIVGIANFVPLIGPFIGAVPGILLALTVSRDATIAAAIVYLVAQQIEGNVVTPLVQRSAVSIPPALLLIALAGLGAIFGIMGVILAAPLAVVLYTLTVMLWVRDTLGYDVPIPGQGNGKA